MTSGPEDCCRWRQVIALYRERTRSFLASYFSLAALNFRKVWFFSLCQGCIKISKKISLVIVPYFSKAISLGPLAFYSLTFKGMRAVSERRASESIKRGRDVLRPRSALACTHLWSSLWMEFCAYSSPNLAFKGYIVHSSVCLRTPFRTLSSALTVDRSLRPKLPREAAAAVSMAVLRCPPLGLTVLIIVTWKWVYLLYGTLCKTLSWTVGF